MLNISLHKVKTESFSALSRQHQRFPIVGTDYHVPTANVGKEESYPLTLDVLNNEQSLISLIVQLYQSIFAENLKQNFIKILHQHTKISTARKKAY
jgi:hypothetical protein